ncbi:MAG: AraC family transcriptional regulator [Bacteroidota bacterium]
MHEHPTNLKEKEYQLRIKKVLSYIQEYLTEDLSLDKLAGIACFSPFHFQKIFSLYVGESPKQYMMRLRLERIAHYLVLYPELSIGEASFQCGFSSPSTFIRAFKKYYGTTPEAFRKLPFDEISKIGIYKPNKGKSFDLEPSEFWGLDLTPEEVTGLTSEMKTEVIAMRSLKVAFMDSHLGDEDAIPKAFKALTRWAEPRDLIVAGTQYLGIMLDMPFFTEYGKCRYRACITISDELSLPKEINTFVLPAGRYATFTMKGTIQSVFSKLVAFRHGWLEQSGYQIAEITGFELFTENPAKKPYEGIQRRVFIPVKPV